MKILFVTAVGIALLLSSGIAHAEDKTAQAPGMNSVHTIQLPVVPVQLKPGPGLDKVSTLCNICHSTDYITMQPNFPRATWTSEVTKMIKVMGAPINEEDAKTIINYLVVNYGTGN